MPWNTCNVLIRADLRRWIISQIFLCWHVCLKSLDIWPNNAVVVVVVVVVCDRCHRCGRIRSPLREHPRSSLLGSNSFRHGHDIGGIVQWTLLLSYEYGRELSLLVYVWTKKHQGEHFALWKRLSVSELNFDNEQCVDLWVTLYITNMLL